MDGINTFTAGYLNAQGFKMPAISRVHSPFYHDFRKKIITRKLYEIKS
jgi:hypothetical protein